MLKSLTVTNFALIEQTSVEFVEGLNILTGETGAGKSILIDALGIILGNRASLESIRSDCDHFRIEGVFDITGRKQVARILEEQGIPVEEDETVIISRRLSRHGKNAIIINGCHIPLIILRQIGEKLIDMHGQHEHQALLRPESHLALIDACNKTIREKVEKYREVYKKWAGLNTELSHTEERSRERAQRLDMISWQTQEIAAATLEIGEDEKMEQEINILANAEKIANAVNRGYSLLNQGSKGLSSVLTSLSEVKREIENAVRYDQRLQTQLTIILDSIYQLEECSITLRDYADGIDFNPNRLSALQDRMDTIYKLKKKYGATIAAILNYYQQAMDELSAIQNFDERMKKLLKEQALLREQLSILAAELNNLRQQASVDLAKKISEHLADLGMPKAAITIKVTLTPDFTPTGQNEAIFLFSANPGEETKPLHKIASGGELSRIALAIKTVCTHRDDIGIMVFDEVDAGVGGQTAQMVAEKIAWVSIEKQVLCITHSPAIASMADSHIYIEKKIDGERTVTVVKVLNEPERILELTRMISGNNITKITLDNAAQTLEYARLNKEKWKNTAQT